MNFIKEYRERKNMTQAELGGAVNKSQEAICLYENGQREPSAGLALKIAEVLETSVENLFFANNIS